MIQFCTAVCGVRVGVSAAPSSVKITRTALLTETSGTTTLASAGQQRPGLLDPAWRPEQPICDIVAT
jgi:hypothetical protein